MSSRFLRVVVALLAAVSLAVPFTSTATDALSSAASGRIEAGESHTCVVTSVSGVKCWGANTYGQLGNGLTSGLNPTPVDVKGLASGALAVAAGGRHSCALTSVGGVKCWGQNVNGELGNGSGTQSSTPVDVVGLASGVTAIAAGNRHTCAVTTGGGVKCWGTNEWGQLGDGSVTRRLSPVDVAGLASGVTAIAAGNVFTCAVTSAGGVKCWGGGGLLGNGSGTSSFTPVDVVGLASGVTAIAAGNGHTCALTSGGSVKCWGTNATGQLGTGSISATLSLSPVDVVGLVRGVTAIAAGGAGHTCALTSGGSVTCWGDNVAGDLGNGTTTQSSTPVNVSGLTSGAIAIAAGGLHTCALLGTGGVKCWGYNADGQLGDAFGKGYRTGSATPVNVVGLAVRQTIAVRPSKAAGTIARKTIVTFAATIKPLEPAGSHATARFEVYRKISGAWRLATRRDVVADASGKASLRWTFSTAGSWYVKARALAIPTYTASGWSALVKYTVK